MARMNREEAEKAKEEAYNQYSRETHPAWKEYEAGWKPLREKFEKVSRPAFRKCQDEILRIERETVE